MISVDFSPYWGIQTQFKTPTASCADRGTWNGFRFSHRGILSNFYRCYLRTSSTMGYSNNLHSLIAMCSTQWLTLDVGQSLWDWSAYLSTNMGEKFDHRFSKVGNLGISYNMSLLNVCRFCLYIQCIKRLHHGQSSWSLVRYRPADFSFSIWSNSLPISICFKGTTSELRKSLKNIYSTILVLVLFAAIWIHSYQWRSRCSDTKLEIPRLWNFHEWTPESQKSRQSW